MNQKPRTVVTFSGGLDSTVLLYQLISSGNDVLALSVDYGQRHRVELDHASRLLSELNITHEVADLRSIAHLLGGSSQTDPNVDVPLGHYAADNMKQTVVPNRNMIMLSVTAGWAISQRADFIAYAAHAGDHTIYPDCRPEFAATLGEAIAIADWHKVELITPFIDKSKADIVTLGGQLNVPFEKTWSCYQGGDRHCGACGTCVERREAFLLANVVDPTEYERTAPLMQLLENGTVETVWATTIHGELMPQNLLAQAMANV